MFFFWSFNRANEQIHQRKISGTFKILSVKNWHMLQKGWPPLCYGNNPGKQGEELKRICIKKEIHHNEINLNEIEEKFLLSESEKNETRFVCYGITGAPPRQTVHLGHSMGPL